MIRTLLAGAALALLTLAGSAAAHPHVFAEARLDLAVNPDGTVKSLRHLWRFDDLFSSTVLVEFDKDGDLQLNDAELEEVSKTIYASLADYAYFQVVTADKRDVLMKPPPSLMVTFDEQILIVLFESEPEKPLKLAGKVTFGIYDPTFYTAIEFAKDTDIAVANRPAACTQAVVRPDPDTALAENQSTLTDAFFNDPTGTDMSKIFATRLELDCAKG